MAARIGGVIQVQIDGEIYDAKGDFTYNLGRNKRESVLGADRLHGFKETPQVASLEGKITDRQTLNVSTLLELKDATVTLTLANGKTVVFRNAFYAGDGNIGTGEGEIDFRIEAASAEEV